MSIDSLCRFISNEVPPLFTSPFSQTTTTSKVTAVALFILLSICTFGIYPTAFLILTLRNRVSSSNPAIAERQGELQQQYNRCRDRLRDAVYQLIFVTRQNRYLPLFRIAQRIFIAMNGIDNIRRRLNGETASLSREITRYVGQIRQRLEDSVDPNGSQFLLPTAEEQDKYRALCAMVAALRVWPDTPIRQSLSQYAIVLEQPANDEEDPTSSPPDLLLHST